MDEGGKEEIKWNCALLRRGCAFFSLYFFIVLFFTNAERERVWLTVSRTSIATLSTPSNTHILICSNNEQIKTNDVLAVCYCGLGEFLHSLICIQRWRFFFLSLSFFLLFISSSFFILFSLLCSTHWHHFDCIEIECNNIIKIKMLIYPSSSNSSGFYF